MTKLYFSPGACCMSCHIALIETKTPYDLVYVGKNADQKVRTDFLKINPLAAVPALELDNGKVLTQNIAILEYIADQKPEANLLAKAGTYERADTMRWLSLIASDLQKAFGPLFRLTTISSNENAQEDIKKWCFSNIEKYLSYIEKQLEKHIYLVGDTFSIADAYFYTVYRWSKAVSFPTEKFIAINRYADKMSKRPSVIEVHKREEVYK